MLASIRKHTEYKLMSDLASPSSKLVLDVAFRSCVTLLVVCAVSSVNADEAQPRRQVNNFQKIQHEESDVNASVAPEDESGLPKQQFKSFGTWSAIEPTAATSPDISNAKAPTKSNGHQDLDPSRPLIIPRLIDRPDGIDDQNVGPIPTQPHETIQDSPREAVTTTIPVVPNPGDLVASPRTNDSPSNKESTSPADDQDSQGDVYDSAPQLLTHSDESPAAVPATLNDTQASVWTLAAAQLISTFLGVMLAVGVFLLIRVAAVNLLGVNLGVTFQFGATSKASTKTISENDSADVVPFGTQTSPPDAATEQPVESASDSENANAVDDESDFNLRVIGSDHGDDDSSHEGSVDQENEAGILRSVFEQNLNLIQELDKQNESAA